MALTSLGLLLLLSPLHYGQTEALPTATVKRVSPQDPLYPGDTVTLQCDISDYEDWSYRWFRDRQHLTNENKKTITLSGDAAGSYSCEGSRRDRPTKSQLSDDHSITITALPTAGLTISPNPAYSGETVTLTCIVESGSRWSYRWFRGSREIKESQSAVIIVTADESVQGQYHCQGNKYLRPKSSSPSGMIYLDVTVSQREESSGAEEEEDTQSTTQITANQSASMLQLDPMLF
ncbi:titin-like [Aplochiton taeniatus]